MPENLVFSPEKILLLMCNMPLTQVYNERFFVSFVITLDTNFGNIICTLGGGGVKYSGSACKM